jgi:hypothetical protein
MPRTRKSGTDLLAIKRGTRLTAKDGLGGERGGMVADIIQDKWGTYLLVRMDDGSGGDDGFDTCWGLTNMGIGWYIEKNGA